MFAMPAMAQGYGMCSTCGADLGYGAMICDTCGASVGYGAGMGAYGSNAMVGAPQDCMATVSCNVPVTQMVPYMTTETQMTTVQKPVVVPQQSSVTVPETVTVPEQVPVQVPAVAYQPCTTMVPQNQTFNMCSADMGSMMASCGTAGAAAPSYAL
jgi:hypothetical protein